MKMTRRGFLKAAGAGISLAPIPARAAEKPNIILCMADDQGYGDMAYTGHPILKTPHFDAMASEALRFDRFYAAAPVCSPTRGSVMTGRHPNRYGCFSWGRSLRPQETMIAEVLKKAGYVTGHFGKWHLGSVQMGSPVNPGNSGFDEWLSAENFFDNDPILSREGRAVQCKGESSAVTVDAALEFIRKHSASAQPFFAVVWFGSPHGPHEAIQEDQALYPEEPGAFKNFYGEITGMDRAFGKLRDSVRELGIRDNTLLWYCSDNGGLPKVGATGGRGNKGDIYEGGLRVPAILEWPARIPAPRTTAVPCVTSDFMPTLASIVGAELDGAVPLDGIDLTGLIDGKMETRAKPIGFWKHPTGGISTPSAAWMKELLEAQQAGKDITDVERLRLDAGEIKTKYPEDSFPGHAAWLDWPWKLHRIQKDESAEARLELYQIEDDPMESKNLAEQNPARVEKMLPELEAWLQSVARSLNGKDYH